MAQTHAQTLQSLGPKVWVQVCRQSLKLLVLLELALAPTCECTSLYCTSHIISAVKSHACCMRQAAS